MLQQISISDSMVLLAKELAETRKLLQSQIEQPRIALKWRPRKEVMEFFGYGDTQMGTLEKNGEIIVSRVGNRKFVNVDSILRLLEKNIQKG